MDKKTKGIIIILVVLIVAVIAFLCYTYAKDFNKNDITSNNVVQAKNEVTTNIVENKTIVEANTIKENVVEPTISEQVKEPEKKPQEDNSEVQDNNDETKAIAIVKKDIGATDGLSFKVENNGDGSYEVCVRDENSRALAWYTVWPKTGKFTK